jgi:hypothetical protein
VFEIAQWLLVGDYVNTPLPPSARAKSLTHPVRRLIVHCAFIYDESELGNFHGGHAAQTSFEQPEPLDTVLKGF